MAIDQTAPLSDEVFVDDSITLLREQALVSTFQTQSEVVQGDVQDPAIASAPLHLRAARRRRKSQGQGEQMSSKIFLSVAAACLSEAQRSAPLRRREQPHRRGQRILRVEAAGSRDHEPGSRRAEQTSP